MERAICPICNSEFKYLTSGRIRKYCSKGCSNKGRKGLKRSLETIERIRQATLEVMSIEDNRKKISLGVLRYYDKHPERKEAIRNENLERLKDPNYVRKILVYDKTCKNKTEMEMDTFLNAEFPDEFKYVGDGKISIEGKIPDWINKDGYKIIELYGNHWHTLKEAEKRIKFFEKHGYKTLIIWASEFYHNKYIVKNKISKLLE